VSVTGAAAQRWAAHLWVPSGRRGSHVDDVAEISALMRAPLEDWQLEAVDALTAFGRGGLPLTLEGVILAPRQNGKTFGVMRPIAVTECLYGPPSLSTWSAQLKDTALGTFNELKALMGRKRDGTPFDEDLYVPELGDHVVEVTETDSEEGLLFANRSELAFRVRSGKAGRGKRPRKLYVDEALFFSDDEAAATMPGMGRQGPTAGVLFASSGALATSGYLHELVRRGRGQDPTLTFVEYCAAGSYEEPGCASPDCGHDEGTDGCAWDDRALWAAANPAFRLGEMTESFLVGMRRGLKQDFAREMLGWHVSPEAAKATISVKQWKARTDALSRIRKGARPSFAVDVRPDGLKAAIAVAGERADGAAHAGVIRYRDGTDWVVEELVRLRTKHRPRFILVDGASEAAGLIPEMKRANLDVTVTSAQDMGQACSGLRRAVLGKRIWHRGSSEVVDALEVAVRRDLGDGGWGWARKKTDGDICPLVAVTLAHLGFMRSPRFYDVTASVM